MHIYHKRIYYHDTDCGGVVYYANYLKFLEEARTELMRDLSIDLAALSKAGTWFVVKRVEIDYKAPAHYADTLAIETNISKIKNVSLEFSQTIKRGLDILCIAKTTLVCVDSSFKPAVIDTPLQKKLSHEISNHQ